MCLALYKVNTDVYKILLATDFFSGAKQLLYSGSVCSESVGGRLDHSFEVATERKPPPPPAPSGVSAHDLIVSVSKLP